jgi:Glycosyltransferase
MNRIRIGFTFMGGHHWLGGYNYLLNLLYVLKQHAADSVDPFLHVGDDVAKADIDPFLMILGPERVITSPVFRQSRKRLRDVTSFVLGTNLSSERVFRKQGIGVVFESSSYYGWRFEIPVIAWLPDFQHRHLPQLFDWKGYWKREVGFRAQLLSGRTLLVSSEDARQDLERFYGKQKSFVHVVPFAVRRPGPEKRDDPESIRVKYRLPPSFFFLPNQFWKHKNHSLVIDALKIAKDEGYEVVVAASGNPKDPRHPGLFEQLQEKVRISGLQENFKYLGMVPYKDLIGLMESANAVLNPSLFEGWSTTVEEAKSLGAPLILSDIPVHREQAPEGAFFDPLSAGSLTGVLVSALGSNLLEKRECLRRQAEAETPSRLREFAERFALVVEHAACSRP